MIFVTGGTGFLGSHIVRKLVDGGHAVRVLARNRERAEDEGRLDGIPVDWATGNVTEPASLTAALEGVDQIVHTAAIAIEKGEASYEKVNYQGTVNVVDGAQQAGIRRFINISQMGADPNLPYRFLASKGRAQAYVANSELDWTAFRPSVIFGPEDEFANIFARLVPLSPVIYPIVGTEDSRFQPVWVDDVASAVAQAVGDEGTIRNEYELGGPEVLTLEEIERRTLRAIDAQRIMIRFPMPLLRLIVALLELTLPSPPVTRSLLELLQVSNVPSDNALDRFVKEPRAFTPENVAAYMRTFRVGGTLKGFFSR
ncbi:MAG: complex I NDUFA9 subunit family protein [Anaerolineales bacterium]